MLHLKWSAFMTQIGPLVYPKCIDCCKWHDCVTITFQHSSAQKKCPIGSWNLIAWLFKVSKLMKFILKHIWMHWFQIWFWFWNYVFNKVIIFTLFKTWMPNINDINHNIIKQLLYLACNYKLDMKNANVKKIN